MLNINEKLKAYQSLHFLIAALILWALTYAQTLYSMVEIWWRSETFAHGFLIFPISLYLIYQKRDLFNSTQKQPSFIFLVLLIFTVLIWVVANAVDVIVIQQLMVIFMLPFIVGTLYGWQLVRQYLFPFFYLLFAVPIGEFLIPKLQQITAAITVFGLEVSQIPVYSEGMFISIPSGDFEVAIACSGIRYLIASLALGTLYAYLMYSSYIKRGVFILASLFVPIVANGIRAYGIVLIAHLSDMKYATGVDHLIYGWLFFGFVIFILFYIGSFWEDKADDENAEIEQPESETPGSLLGSGKAQKSFLAGLTLIMLAGPIYSMWLLSQQQLNNNSLLTVPDVAGNWILSERAGNQWSPIFINADKEIRVDYVNSNNDKKVYFYKNEYLFETQGKELVNSMNHFYNHNRWIVIKKSIQSINSNQVIEYDLRSNQGKLVVWGWYEVLGVKLTHPIMIKIVQAWGKISSKDAGGHFTAIASPYFENVSDGRTHLNAFYKQHFLEK